MKGLVLDTNVLIRFLERKNVDLALFARYDRIVLPTVVVGEFRAGIDPDTKSGRRRMRVLDDFIADDAVELVSIDDAVSRRYADVFRLLSRNGDRIPQNDIWIAATALALGMPLCTDDDHFSRVPLLARESC